MRAAAPVLVALALAAATSAAAQEPAEADSADDPRAEGLPLQPTRTLSTTLEEGSWISLDVSPDGRTVVFDLLGDLWTVPLQGGAATPLTSGMAFDAQPRFGPDGERIVFTSDRSGAENVWIVSRDLTDTVQITDEDDEGFLSPEWTPDGDYLVVTQGGDLHLYHVEGGGGATMLEEDGTRITGAAFGTDDRYVWYSGRETSGSLYNNGLDLYQLGVYDRETGESSERSDRWGGAFRPTLSPDGRWLAYATRHIADTGIRLRDVATGEERWLAYPVQRDDQESSANRDAYPGMSFTPDSRELVASYGGRIWRIPVEPATDLGAGPGEPVEVPFTADVELPIGPLVDFDYPVEDAGTFVAKQIRDAVPSPDGTRLAFTVMQELYVVDWPADTTAPLGEPERLAEGLDAVQQHPTWSPDGRWIAFASWTDADAGHLWRVEADGSGGPERLTSAAALYHEPVWSPDGERILAVRGTARAYEEALTRGGLGEPEDLVWVPGAPASAQGSEVNVIGPTQGLDGFHFTDDPDRIWATSGSDGLVSMRWDMTDRRGVVAVRGRSGGGGPGPSASVIYMSPAGGQALAQVLHDLYVVTVPRVGGETPEISVANPDNAAFPARRLTDIGGQFPTWGPDGRTVHWSIGNAHMVYDLERAEEVEDSLEALEEAEEDPDTADAPGEPGDTVPEGDAASPDQDDEEGYRPFSRRIEVPYERDLPEGVAVLRGARIVTMDGDEVIEDGDLVVRGNRIEAVGPRGEVEVPAGAEVIDVSGRTIVPGFVDTHAHLRAAYGFHRPQPWSYAANLAFGVTTSRDPQTGSTDVLTYEDMVRAGRMLGPRIYSTGPGVFGSENIRDLDHARDVLRRYSDYYDTKTLKMYVAGNREQRQWIIMAARELGLMPTTEGALDLEGNLTHAQDGYAGIEHNLPGVPLFRDVVALLAESETATTPTLLVTYGGPWAENFFYTTEDVLNDARLRRFTPFEEIQQKALRRPGPTSPGGNGWFHPDQYPFPLVSDFVDRVVEAGGRAGVGSHGQLQGLGYHWELWAVGSAERMTPHEALRIATIVGAEALGLDRDLGSIEPGKLADLVILEQNPLEDLRATTSLDRVMLNGRLYDSMTLDEVWPRERPAPAFYWLEAPAEPDPVAGIDRGGG